MKEEAIYILALYINIQREMINILFSEQIFLAKVVDHINGN
jgi:hypothetical protein